MKLFVKLATLAILSVLLMWLPFFLKINNPWGLDFKEGIQTVWKNFDGPNYIIVAKTWYNKALIGKTFSNPLPLEYYPAHWPLYPAIIAVFDVILPGPWAMLFASLLGLVFFYFAFVKFLQTQGLKEKQILILGLASLILPARWLALRSVGSPEAWFMGFVLLSLTSYKQKKYWLAGLWGLLAQLTKSPAILLLASFGIYELFNYLKKKNDLVTGIIRLIKVSPMALGILIVFSLYYWQTGDFLAYLKSGDNFHLFWPPFLVFGKGGIWVGDFWLEEFIWLWLIYGLGIIKLIKQKYYLLGIFGAVFFSTTLFVSHRDISRYILPIMPLILFAWRKTILKKEFLWILILLILPVYLFAWNFLLHNIAPVADWAPYL